MVNSETLSEYSERLEQCLNKYKIKRFDDLYLSENDLKPVGTIETTIEFIENKNDLDKPIAQQENINSYNAPDHNEDKNGAHDSNFSTGNRNPNFLMTSIELHVAQSIIQLINADVYVFLQKDFPFDIKKFEDSFNLIEFNLWIKEVDEVENLPCKLLRDSLESLSVAPEYQVYREDVVSHLELRLQTLNATLEKIYYLFPLQYEFRDKLLSNLKTYIDRYYRIIYNYYPNYNVIFLLINLRDTLQSIQVDGQKKPLKKSIIPEIIINAGVSLPQNALNFLQTIDHIHDLTGWYKKWRDLLNICRSLDISTRQLSNSFSQSHKEIYLLEFLWQYVLCQISDHTIPVANVSKEILNDKTAFLHCFNKNKGPICSLNSLWFGTLNLAQDVCRTTSQPVILVASYYLSLTSLRKSQCVYIKFKSLEVLYSLLLREPEQIHDVLKEKISEFYDSELKFLSDIVYKKLKLDNKFIKSKDYVSIFQGKDLTKNIVTILKGIIKEKLICTTLNKPIGDFFDLDCKHVISRLAIINQKACPFCKLNIDPKLICNFTSNAIIKGFYEKLEDFDDYIMNERQTSKNIPPESKLMKKAKTAEKQQKYLDVIAYLDKVMQFYPERYNYSAQCRKANAIWELGLRENQETAIKLHVKARDILTSAIQLNPNDTFAYVCRGKIYLQHNNNVEALKDFESVQKFDPNNRDAFLYKLMILNKVENTEFSKIIKRNKLNSTSIISILTTIKPRKMIFGLGNSLPVRLYSFDDSTISGYVFFKIYKNFIKAIKNLEDAIARKPKEPYWHCQLGALLYELEEQKEQKHYDTSLKELNCSINLFQSSKSKYQSQKNKFQRILMSETYHYRGLLHKTIGKLQMANSDFEKANELNKDYEIPQFTNANLECDK
ncbi:36548_t:CDS:2 [Gigaspora margarita]|uniref:36548_t:CDS:1 n=1 Tax=Gigaspora margarita TaxID=4874 RepID=A0ABM8VXT8_GIGMA|nr:36548_t:CDS:2 [Gigaspora margarita]